MRRSQVTQQIEGNSKPSPAILNTFPYMHDGRFETLAEVVEFYNMGGHPSPTLDPIMKAAGVGRNWSSAMRLIDFMKTPSDTRVPEILLLLRLGNGRIGPI